VTKKVTKEVFPPGDPRGNDNRRRSFLNQNQHGDDDPRNFTRRLRPSGSPMAGTDLVPHRRPGKASLAARNFLRAKPYLVIKKFRPGMPNPPGRCSGGSLGRVLFKENAEKEFASPLTPSLLRKSSGRDKGGVNEGI
jgi:hypothetical protein